MVIIKDNGVTDLLSASPETKSIDTVPSQPVPRAEIITEGMSQVVVIPDSLHHRHDPLQSAVDKGARSGYNVGSAPMSVVAFFLVAAVECVVQVQ